MKRFFYLLAVVIPTAANAAWGPDIKLSTNEVAATLNENMGQCIVANGNALHAVWCDTNNNGSAIYYKRSLDAGVTWGADTRISPNPGSDSFPLLAVSSSTLHLVFLRDNGTTQAASYYKHSTDGGTTWGPDVPLGNTKYWPGVAAAGSMVYVSLNTALTSTNTEVYFRRSTDNGVTWQPQQQISNAEGRSEDPAICAYGNYVELAWNDNRETYPSGGMAVYYRRSTDMGVTWGPETGLTHTPGKTYFPTINLYGSHADIAYGMILTTVYNIYHLHSPDSGSTWQPIEQITSATATQFYPSILRDGSNVHLAWTGAAGIVYQHSGNGGTSWDPAVSLVTQGTAPFIAVSGNVLNMIFISQRDGHGAIYYKRNPTGNAAISASAARDWTEYQ